MNCPRCNTPMRYIQSRAVFEASMMNKTKDYPVQSMPDKAKWACKCGKVVPVAIVKPDSK